ncbi:MAG: 2-oxo acid dehydrogenase subunit E2 [Dehalococcoidia bacterium]|nr:2-oxo acid dehydrogenase subunit E2 [Dehalococcoidia bacterium]
MATEVVMPQMGYDMKEGKVLKWLVNEGQQVNRGDPLAEIETDKATIEMEAFAGGLLRKIVVPEGETVPVGTLLGYIGAANEALPDASTRPTKPSTAASARSAPSPAPAGRQATDAPPPASDPQPSGELRASPIARRIAQERGVDISQLQGSGPRGRVTERDVQAYLERPPARDGALARPPAPAPTAAPRPADGLTELSRMRQAIARLTTRSKREVPHYYVTVEIDMGEAMELRRKLNQRLDPQGVRISVNDLLVKGCALALVKHPEFNTSYVQDKVLQHADINVGIAIAVQSGGLVVPAVLDCGNKSLVDIARATKDLIERTQAQRLREHEYTGATFGISNLGALDVDSFAAIIHPPQCAVLAVGAVRKQPIVKNDQVVVGQTMKATLSADHRLTDGLQAAQFLVELKSLLEQPVGLLL